MSNEHRITNLEKLALNLGTRIEEAASDNAEELKAIRADIKASFKQIGDTIVKVEESLETVKVTMVTKDELDEKLATMKAEINQGIADLKTGLLEALRDLKKDS